MARSGSLSTGVRRASNLRPPDAPIELMPMVYLDHSATTPLDPEVLQAMMPYLTEEFGNASSVYGLGQRPRQAIDQARDEAAALSGAVANEGIFIYGVNDG